MEREWYSPVSPPLKGQTSPKCPSADSHEPDHKGSWRRVNTAPVISLTEKIIGEEKDWRCLLGCQPLLPDWHRDADQRNWDVFKVTMGGGARPRLWGSFFSWVSKPVNTGRERTPSINSSFPVTSIALRFDCSKSCSCNVWFDSWWSKMALVVKGPRISSDLRLVFSHLIITENADASCVSKFISCNMLVSFLLVKAQRKNSWVSIFLKVNYFRSPQSNPKSARKRSQLRSIPAYWTRAGDRLFLCQACCWVRVAGYFYIV